MTLFRFVSRVLLPAVVIVGVLPPALARAADKKKQVKVFILAGQSNMEGKAAVSTLDAVINDPKTHDQFKHLKPDGKWLVRDDVFAWFKGHKGPLTIGFGWPGKTGIELEFGTVLGNHFEEPVLVLKGGCNCNMHTWARTPSATSEEFLQKKLEEAKEAVKKHNEKHKRKRPVPTMDSIKNEYGAAYRFMLSQVKEVFDNYETLYPALKGKKLELAGFLWFQGFSDGHPSAADEYESNMKLYIKDVRKDLKAPKLPFVIAAIGMNGSTPAKGGLLKVRNAQMAMNDVPEFKGNVKAFRTDLLADKLAEGVFRKPKSGNWLQVGSDRPCHYLGSAIWHNRIGRGQPPRRCWNCLARAKARTSSARSRRRSSTRAAIRSFCEALPPAGSLKVVQ